MEYLPDHVIPQAGSAFHQSLRVELERGSRAIVLDSLAAGRLAHGEKWSFREFDSKTEILVCGGPVHLNRTRICPDKVHAMRPGQMEEYQYLATVGAFADGIYEATDLVKSLNDEFARFAGIYGAATVLARGGCLARYQTRSAYELTEITKRLWAVARERVLRLPPFDHRKY